MNNTSALSIDQFRLRICMATCGKSRDMSRAVQKTMWFTRWDLMKVDKL